MSTRPPDKETSGPPYQSVKGMRDLIGEDWFRMQGFFEKASEIALYYGFTPIEVPMLEDEQVFIRTIGETSEVVSKELYSLQTKGGSKLAIRPEFTAGIVRAYIEHGMQTLPQPVMLMTYGPLFRHDKPQRGRYRELYQFGMEILGSDRSINDVTIIRVVSDILNEVGLTNHFYKINSLGDKDCRMNHKKALIAYYKRFQKDLSPRSRELLKTNPLRILDSKEPSDVALKEEAPASMSYLSGPSKQHFKEVLECLEALNIAYEVDPALVRGLDYYNRTVFEYFIPNQETDESADNDKPQREPIALGGGGRYDYLAKILGAKRDVPAVGVGMGVDRITEGSGYKFVCPRVQKKARGYFIQLGAEAKMRSLTVIEVLRTAKFPIAHSLSKDSLGAQLGRAEELGIPYAIILGQKEVMENSVIVRNMQTRSQDSVKLEKLTEYVKKLK